MKKVKQLKKQTKKRSSKSKRMDEIVKNIIEESPKIQGNSFEYEGIEYKLEKR